MPTVLKFGQKTRILPTEDFGPHRHHDAVISDTRRPDAIGFIDLIPGNMSLNIALKQFGHVVYIHNIGEAVLTVRHKLPTAVEWTDAVIYTGQSISYPDHHYIEICFNGKHLFSDKESIIRLSIMVNDYSETSQGTVDIVYSAVTGS